MSPERVGDHGKKEGRPRKEIAKLEFEQLCKIQCTETEICGIFGICEDTLNAWCKRTYKQTFSEVYKIYAQDGKVSLRRMQFNLAKKSPAMAIFLGKNMLGQSDEPTIENNDAAVASANAQITALADLIRNPQPNRTMDDVTGQEDGTP